MYRSAQRQFIDFCTLDGYVSSNGSLLPTNEQTLLRFCSPLSGRLHHSSIKVYLSAIRSLHIDQGFPDSLENCLQLQHLLRGIKRHQGSTFPQRQPVTAHLMRFIQRSLDTHNSEHVMLWAACCLGFFGFLRAEEFTVNSTFDPSIHLTVQDLQIDAEVNPSSLRVCIKSSKTDPLRQECFIYLGRGQAPLCPISAILAYLHLRGLSSGPLFIDIHGRPLTRSRLSSCIQSVLQGAVISGQFSGHSFRIGAATTAEQCGIPDHLIKTMGRWTSDAYQLYVRTPVESIWKFLGGCFSNRYLIKGVSIHIRTGAFGFGR